MRFSSISILQEHFLAPFSEFPLQIKNKRFKSQCIQTPMVQDKIYFKNIPRKKLELPRITYIHREITCKNIAQF